MPCCPINHTQVLLNLSLKEGRMGFTAWRESADQVDQIVKELMNTIYPLEWGMSGSFNINHKLCTRHLVMFDINLKVYKIKFIRLFIRHQKLEYNVSPEALKLWSKPDRQLRKQKHRNIIWDLYWKPTGGNIFVDPCMPYPQCVILVATLPFCLD